MSIQLYIFSHYNTGKTMAMLRLKREKNSVHFSFDSIVGDKNATQTLTLHRPNEIKPNKTKRNKTKCRERESEKECKLNINFLIHVCIFNKSPLSSNSLFNRVTTSPAMV